MEGTPVEYIIKQKNEGRALWLKIGLLVLYPVAFAILAALILTYMAPLLHIPFLLLLFAFIALLVFVTWKFTAVEYEIVISNSDLTLTVIYGKNLRRHKATIGISSISEIGLYDDTAYARVSKMSLQKNYLFVSSLSAPVIYYAIFDEGKEKCILYFEMTDDRGISRLKKLNSAACRAGGIK